MIFAHGYTKIRIEGFFVERFLNLCMNKNIKIWDIKSEGECVSTLKINSIDVSKLDEISNITKTRMEIVKECGVPNIAKKYKKRKIFLVLFLITVVLIYFISKRIWSIEIIGDFSIPIEEVRSELLNEGVKIGILKDDIDFDEIKRNIYMRREDILWIGFDIKGIKAKIEVVERTNKNETQYASNTSDIIADKDGIITKINVKEGTKVVNIGDIVYKGDIIVKGIMESEHSETRYVHANADISIKTWYIGKFYVPFKKDVISKTGKEERDYKLKIGNCSINLGNSGTKLEKYDKISNVKELILFGNIKLPITLDETIYEEIDVSELNYTQTQAENLAKNEAYNLAKSDVPSDAKIINTDYKVFYTQDGVTVKATIECEEKMEGQSPKN